MQVPREWDLGVGAPPQQLTVFAEDGGTDQLELSPVGTLLVIGFTGDTTSAQVTWTGGVTGVLDSCFRVTPDANTHTCPNGTETTLYLDGTPGTITVTWNNNIQGISGTQWGPPATYGSYTVNVGYSLPPGTVVKANPPPPEGGGGGGSGGGGGGALPPVTTPPSNTGTYVAVGAAVVGLGAAAWYFLLR